MRARLADRAARFDPITDENLAAYVSGYEVPDSDDEEVVILQP